MRRTPLSTGKEARAPHTAIVLICAVRENRQEIICGLGFRGTGERLDILAIEEFGKSKTASGETVCCENKSKTGVKTANRKERKRTYVGVTLPAE